MSSVGRLSEFTFLTELQAAEDLRSERAAILSLAKSLMDATGMECESGHRRLVRTVSRYGRMQGASIGSRKHLATSWRNRVERPYREFSQTLDRNIDALTSALGSGAPNELREKRERLMRLATTYPF